MLVDRKVPMRTVTHKAISYLDQDDTIPQDTEEYSELDKIVYEKQL